MPCKLMVTSTPVTERTKTSIVSLPMSSVIPSRTFTVTSASQAQLCMDDYTAEVAATGKPATIVGFKPSNCRGRKPSGFDRAVGGTRYVNLETLPVSA